MNACMQEPERSRQQHRSNTAAYAEASAEPQVLELQRKDAAHDAADHKSREAPSARPRKNKLVKDSTYDTKLSGTDFFKWAKEQKAKQKEIAAQSVEDGGKVESRSRKGQIGYSIYSDYVKKMYAKARQELGKEAAHKAVMHKIAEWWKVSDERTANLHSKAMAEDSKASSMAESTDVLRKKSKRRTEEMHETKRRKQTRHKSMHANAKEPTYRHVDPTCTNHV